MWGLRTVPLLPILIPQALWVASRAARLPEAAGPREGVTGTGARLRLVILGDSSAAGVGAATQDDALAGQLIQGLADSYEVEWTLLAQSGATAASALSALDVVEGQKIDVVVVVLGVNDAKNGVRAISWMRGMGRILVRLRRDFAVPHMLVTGLPPVGDFPVLPAPLRAVLGARARRFDALLREVADANKARHVGLDFPMVVADMAPDGFHPGPRLYAAWGAHLADAVKAKLQAA